MGRDITLEAAIVEWLDSLACMGRAPNTIRNHRSRMACYLLRPGAPGRALASRRLRRLTTTDFEDFLGELAHRGLAIATVRVIRSNLRAALERARGGRRLSYNPVAEAQVPLSDSNDFEPDHPDPADLPRILELTDSASPTFGLGLRLVIAAVGRQSEIRALQWGDIDLSTGMLHLTHTFDVSESGEEVRRPLKVRQRRILPLGPPVLDALEAHAARRGYRDIAEIPPDAYVLSPSPQHDIPYSPNWLGMTWRRKVQKALEAETGRHVRLHDLRGFSASQLADEGLPMSAVQHFGGWRDPRTAQVYYLRTGRQLQHRSRRALDGLVSSG